LYLFITTILEKDTCATGLFRPLELKISAKADFGGDRLIRPMKPRNRFALSTFDSTFTFSRLNICHFAEKATHFQHRHSEAFILSSASSTRASQSNMLKSRPARTALRSLQRRGSLSSPPASHFSTTPATAGVASNRTGVKANSPKAAPETAKRDQSTAAAPAM
jgi:hypothetical protein